MNGMASMPNETKQHQAGGFTFHFPRQYLYSTYHGLLDSMIKHYN